MDSECRSQWPRGLRRRSAAARLLRLWVRIPPGHGCLSGVSVVLSGRVLCDELITRPEESYRLWCVVVCDLETSGTRRPWPALGRSATEKKKIIDGRTRIITITESYSLNSINRLIFIMTVCVLCEVETEILYTLIGIACLRNHPLLNNRMDRSKTDTYTKLMIRYWWQFPMF